MMNYRPKLVVIAALLLFAWTADFLVAQDPNSDRDRQRERMQEQRERMQRGGRRGRPGQGRRGRGGSEQHALVVGEIAPDFTLKSLDGKSETTLSDFRENKPVVLFFGSYT